MKNYIVEEVMNNATDGHFQVVVEGEKHINRTVIKNGILFFTTQAGYDYCHPVQVARQNAKAIANGLNKLEKLKDEQRKVIVEHPNY